MSENGQYRWRVFAIATVLAACLALVVVKLVYLQVIQHDYYLALAKEEHWRQEEIPAERGTILDANGHPLATSVLYETLLADTSQISDPLKTAESLAPVIGEPVAQLRDKLSQPRSAATVLKEGLPYEIGQNVRKLALPGLYTLPVPRRVYPEGKLAAQTLGVVGADNRGLSGIELALDDTLGGKPGSILAERDTGGEAIALTIREYVLPERGRDVMLTIDRFVQEVAERELERGVESAKAKGGSVVVMNPRTGALLAVANRPSFDPADPNLFSEDKVPLYRNAAACDMYEPGSIFKIITMAAGLDSGAVTVDHAYLNEGSFSYAGGVVKNAISRPQGMETMTEILVRSSNIGAAYVAVRTGADSFYQYVREFGFGETTGVEIPGESPGLVKTPGTDSWAEFDLATNAFGQGISVTPLQMAAAAAAVANGGTLMKPQLIKAISGPNGFEEYSPVVMRQVIRPTTAKALTEMLVAAVDAVDGGQPRQCHVPGYRLAGKTGTAEIPDTTGYRQGATIASFVGFGPADDPRFVILVKLIEPQTSPWAEAVASPVFREIAEQLLAYYGVPPTEAPSASVGQ